MIFDLTFKFLKLVDCRNPFCLPPPSHKEACGGQTSIAGDGHRPSLGIMEDIKSIILDDALLGQGPIPSAVY